MYVYGFVILLMFFVLLLARKLVIWQNRQRNPRGLFYFNNGVQVVGVDPIAVMMALENHEKYIQRMHLAPAWQGDLEATAICVDACRNAFNVPAFTSKSKPGLTDRECLNLLDCFYWYAEGVKKNTELSSSLPPSMEPTSPSSMASAG